MSVEYLSGGDIRFVLDHWGRQSYVSAPIHLDRRVEHRLDISHPFYAPGRFGRARAGEGDLAVSVDGREVWRLEPMFYPVEAEDIFLGANPIGGIPGPDRFSGIIALVE
jgi:hypothetical protein